VRAVQAEGLKQRPSLGVGKVEQRPPIEVQQVEREVGDRHLGGEVDRRGGGAHVDARLQGLEVRPAGRRERHDLAVEDRLPPAQGGAEAAQFGVGHGDVLAGPGDQPDPPALGVDERAHAVPFHLQCPAVVVGRQGIEAGQHGLEPFRQRQPFPVDHPGVVPGLEQGVPAGQPLSAQHHLDLVRLPLDGVVGATVGDRDRARPVLAGRYLAGEPGVGERVVLGVDSQVVGCRVGGHSLGDRPGHKHAVALEPEVPVQPAGPVFLDHEDAG